MYFIENDRLIECKNKALHSWSKHNFIFKQFALVVKQKIIEIKKNFNNILIISSDFDEIISQVVDLRYENLCYFTQYKSFLENISLKSKKVIKIFSSIDTLPFKKDSFDLVVCNLCFHNINKKNQYLNNLKGILKKNGLLICNYFGESSLVELKNSFLVTDQEFFGGSFMRFPKNITLVEFSQMLMQAGFKEVVTEKINYEIFYEDVLSILKDIRGMGESGFHSFKNKRMNIGYYKELNRVYKKNFSDRNSKLKLSCEIISSSSWKN